MNIEQPMSNIILPEDLQNQIIAGRLAIADLETRVSILNAQTNSLRKDNASLTKEQDYLTSENARVRDVLDKIRCEIISEQERVVSISESCDKREKELLEKEGIQGDKMKKFIYDLESLSKEQNSFKLNCENFEAKEVKFYSDKEDFETWVGQVHSIISKVN